MRTPQTPPKYLIGDVFLAHDGSIGVIAKVNITPGQPDPFYVQYSAEKIGEYILSKNAWWMESEFKEVLKGPLHQIISGEVKLRLE